MRSQLSQVACSTVATFLSIASVAIAQDDGWVMKAACGLNLARGNSDVAAANLEISADKKGADNEFHMGGRHAYGETDDEVTEDNSKLDAQYNRLLTRRVYLYLNGKAERDDIAMLDYRTLVGPGAGFYLLKSEQHNFKIEAGVSYMREKLTYTETVADVPARTEDKNDTTALRLYARYDGILGRSQIWQSVEYLPAAEDLNDYLLTGEIGIETVVTDVLSLRLTITDRYDSDPAPGSEENDVALRASLVFTSGK